VSIDILESALPGLSGCRSSQPRGIDWGILESELGVVLPSDYKELAEYYPTFEVCGFFSIGYPQSGSEHLFLEGISSALEGLLDSYDAGLSEYPPFSCGEGLIPWGSSSSGDFYYWNFSHKRQVSVVVGSRSDFYSEFPGSLTEFLAAWLSGDIQPDDQPSIEQLGGARFQVFWSLSRNWSRREYGILPSKASV
jgi:hypothetical protein